MGESAMRLVGQIVGFCGMFALFLLYQQRTKKTLLYCKLCADVCWLIHYFLLNAYAGMIPNLIGIFRETVYFQREKKKWANFAGWPILFVVINWSLGIRTFDGIVDLLPMCASTIYTVSLWFQNPHFTKKLSLPAVCLFWIYDLYVKSWAGLLNESISLLSILIYFIRYKARVIQQK